MHVKVVSDLFVPKFFFRFSFVLRAQIHYFLKRVSSSRGGQTWMISSCLLVCRGVITHSVSSPSGCNNTLTRKEYTKIKMNKPRVGFSKFSPLRHEDDDLCSVCVNCVNCVKKTTCVYVCVCVWVCAYVRCCSIVMKCRELSRVNLR